MASLVCEWLKLTDEKGGGQDAAGPSSTAPKPDALLDEFSFLKEFAKQKFDSEKLTGVFSEKGAKPPGWIEQLTQDPRGRQLIYDLSASHRNCLLLNYGIQKILLQVRSCCCNSLRVVSPTFFLLC